MTHHAHENCDCDETAADRRKLAELRDAIVAQAIGLHERGALLPTGLVHAIEQLRAFRSGRRTDAPFRQGRVRKHGGGPPRKSRSTECGATTRDGEGVYRACVQQRGHRGQHVAAGGFPDHYWSDEQ